MVSLRAARFQNLPQLEQCLNGARMTPQGFDADGNLTVDQPNDKNAVAAIQQALIDLGYSVGLGGADGKYGTDTATAVRQFKIDQKLPVPPGLAAHDGVTGPGTMGRLDELFADKPVDDIDQLIVNAKLADVAGTATDPGAQTAPLVLTSDKDGAIARCVRGLVCVTLAREACVVLDPIAPDWVAGGAETGPLGYPTGDSTLVDGRLVQDFVGGGKVAPGGPAPAGPVLSVGLPIWSRWIEPIGGFDPGYPVADSAALPNEEDAELGLFDAATIVSHPSTGGQVLPSPVAALWQSQLAAGQQLGLPTSSGRPADGGGQVFTFTGGAIRLAGDGTVSLVNQPVGDGQSDLPASRFLLPKDLDRHMKPAEPGSTAEAFVGGNRALAQMAADIQLATGPNDFVYLLDWFCGVDLQMRPGDPTSTLRELLGRATLSKDGQPGAQVCAMFWLQKQAPGELTKDLGWLMATVYANVFAPNRVAAKYISDLPNSRAILDTDHLPAGSHHQKVLIVGRGGQLVAWCGGIDINPDRVYPKGVGGSETPGSPLFDVHVRISGPAAQNLLATFVDRWTRHTVAKSFGLRGANFKPAAPVSGPHTVQISHTYGRRFPFPTAVQTGKATLENAIRSARKHLYFTCQYFVGSEPLRAALRAALGTVDYAVVVMAPLEAVGDLPDIAFRRNEFVAPLMKEFPGKLLAFEALGIAGTPTSPEAYVHSKVLLADDQAACVGSLNYSRRSWTHDSEVMATVIDTHGLTASTPPSGFALDLRIRLWMQHLQVSPDAVRDPAAAKALWQHPPANARVRPYDPNAPVTRPIAPSPLPPISPANLDRFWDTAADPQG